MKVPVEILVFLCLLVGMLPAYTVAPLLAAAASASLGGQLPEYSLAIWHGFNLPLLMSVVALVGGVLVMSCASRCSTGMPDCRRWTPSWSSSSRCNVWWPWPRA